MLNELVLIGRLGRNPVVGESKNGTKIVKFSLPLFHSYSPDGKKVEWLQCEVWGKLGNIAEKAEKGVLVTIRGELHNESWQDTDGNWRGRTYLRADSFRFLEKKKSANNAIIETEGETQQEHSEEIEVGEKKLDDIDEFLKSF